MSASARLAALAVSFLLNTLIFLTPSEAHVLARRSPYSTQTLPETPGTPTPRYGQIGDVCGRFTLPPGDPPCAPGLACILYDERVPDMGGICGIPSSSSTPTISTLPTTATPTPTPTYGQPGDACGRFKIPLDPPCAPGLACIPYDERIPDLGGVCGTPSSSATPTPSTPSTTTPTSTPTPTYGQSGDPCNRYRIPLDPPCAPGLTCILHDERIPDLGGVCGIPSSPPTPTTSTPTPTPTYGHPGSPCNRFILPLDPPCAPGLTCILRDPRLPDAGGVCGIPLSTTPTPTPTRTTTSPPACTPPPILGKEGDFCDQAILPSRPPCGPGLICVHEARGRPGAAGRCRRVVVDGSPSAAALCTTVITTATTVVTTVITATVIKP